MVGITLPENLRRGFECDPLRQDLLAGKRVRSQGKVRNLAPFDTGGGRQHRQITRLVDWGYDSIPIVRSITHDDSIVLTPLNQLNAATELGFLVP